MFKKKVFEYNGHQIRKGALLKGHRLVKADLSGLVGRDVLVALGSLEGVDFTAANLTGANFDGLELHKVNFFGANLTEASFKNCWLPQTPRGQETIMIHRNFSHANLSNATITTEPFGAEWPEWFILDDTTLFTGANLDGATLGGTFKGAVFTDASLRGARISSGTKFIDCKFTGASLRGARISSGTRFSNCEFVGTDFSGSHFEGEQTFPPISLENLPCVFVSAGFAGAKFVDMSGCAYFRHECQDPPPEFSVTDGTFYVNPSFVGKFWPDCKPFFWESGVHPIGDCWFAALTPWGIIPRSSAKQSVESKLAEAKQLLKDGLIDQAEHDALRRKILGI